MYRSEKFQNSHHFWGAEGGSKITKAHLVRMVVPCRMGFYDARYNEITSVILGVQGGVR